MLLISGVKACSPAVYQKLADVFYDIIAGIHGAFSLTTIFDCLRGSANFHLNFAVSLARAQIGHFASNTVFCSRNTGSDPSLPLSTQIRCWSRLYETKR